MSLDLIDWILRGLIIIYIFSSKIITYLLKNKINIALNNLIFSISMIPMIPLIWVTRQIMILNNKVDVSFTFYFALIVTIIVLLILIRNIYLYKKNKN